MARLYSPDPTNRYGNTHGVDHTVMHVFAWKGPLKHNIFRAAESFLFPLCRSSTHWHMHKKQYKESSRTNQDPSASLLLALHFGGIDYSSKSQDLAHKMSEWKPLLYKRCKTKHSSKFLACEEKYWCCRHCREISISDNSCHSPHSC